LPANPIQPGKLHFELTEGLDLKLIIPCGTLTLVPPPAPGLRHSVAYRQPGPLEIPLSYSEARELLRDLVMKLKEIRKQARGKNGASNK
jgi:hypothetical protein